MKKEVKELIIKMACEQFNETCTLTDDGRALVKMLLSDVKTDEGARRHIAEVFSSASYENRMLLGASSDERREWWSETVQTDEFAKIFNQTCKG